ncbi:MAG: chemotaxis protein CheC [bacterium]
MNKKINNEIELDILKEVGNIGAGNAATALSIMLDRRVDIQIPFVKNCILPELSMVLGGAEKYVNVIFIEISEALSGIIVFLLLEEDANKLYKLAAQGYDIDSDSVILEVSNIISGAYVGALASMLEDKVDLTPPQLGKDMLGALVGSIIPSLCSEIDKISVIGTKLIVGEEVIEGYYILMLDNTSTEKLVDYLKEKSKTI